MEKMIQLMIKMSIKYIKRHSTNKNATLYELEEAVFDFFKPIQKEVLEKTASELYLKKSNICRLCSASEEQLKSEGIRKKTSQPIR